MEGSSRELSRRDFLKLASLTAASGLLAAACRPFSKLPATEVPKPTPKPPDVPKTQVPTNVTRVPEVASTTVEKQPRPIAVRGILETNPANPSIETIKFTFPEGVVGDKSSLIPPGDTLTAFFVLRSDLPIKTLNLTMADLMGISVGQVGTKMNASSPSETLLAEKYVDTLLGVAKGNNQTLIINNTARGIIRKIEVSCGRPQDGTSGVMVKMSFPNETFYYTDKSGAHQVNPAQRFVTGQVGLGISRRGELAPGTVTGPIPLKAENMRISGDEGGLVATANEIVFTPPLKISVENKTGQPAKIAPAPTSTPGTRITVESENGNVQPKTPEVKSRWVEEKWAPNQTVPLREWWNDMTAKGYIAVDSLAQQHAGREINSLVDGSNLVPNPVDYYKQQYPFIGNCNTALNELVSKSQGHIRVAPEAYAHIPGSNNCQVFSKSK